MVFPAPPFARVISIIKLDMYTGSGASTPATNPAKQDGSRIKPCQLPVPNLTERILLDLASYTVDLENTLMSLISKRRVPAQLSSDGRLNGCTNRREETQLSIESKPCVEALL